MPTTLHRISSTLKQAFIVKAICLPVNIGKFFCSSISWATRILLLSFGFMILTRPFATGSRRMQLRHVANLAVVLLARPLPTIRWLVEGESSLQSLHIGKLFFPLLTRATCGHRSHASLFFFGVALRTEMVMHVMQMIAQVQACPASVSGFL